MVDASYYVNSIFYRYPWIRSIICIVAMVQTFVYTKSWISYVSSGAAAVLWTILGWWWSSIKSLFTFIVQLFCAVSSTTIVYFIMKYIYPHIVKIILYVILPSPPPPPPPPLQSPRRQPFHYEYDSRGSREYTIHEEHMRLAFLQELHRRREEQAREDEKERERHGRNNAKKKGKGKRKGKAKQ